MDESVQTSAAPASEGAGAPQAQASTPQAEPQATEGTAPVQPQPTTAKEAFDMAERNRFTRLTEHLQKGNAIESAPEPGQEQPGAEPTAPGDTGQGANVNPASPDAQQGLSGSDSDTSGTNAGDNQNANQIEQDILAEQKQVTAQIIQSSQQEAEKKMQERGLYKLTINDLAQYDEQTGITTWKNPFNPNEPATTLTQAREIVEEIERLYQDEYDKEFNKARDNWVQRMTPYMEMRAFIPKYNAMSPEEQSVFNYLVSDKAVYDEANPIQNPDGTVSPRIKYFNCNLDEAATLAKQMVANGFVQQQNNQQAQATPQEAPKQKEETPTGPPMDARTSTSAPVENGERPAPQTKYEAFQQAEQDRYNKIVEMINKKKGN